MRSNHHSGFSLVELSIVLVILGLLTGGILGGQALIRAAELRSVTTQLNQFQAAINSFRDKYFALPGDMAKAAQFWGSAGGSGQVGDGCQTATGTGTQTCGGNGDGNIINSGGANQYAERFLFWQHLVNAKLLEGNYTGKSGSAAFTHHTDSNSPKGKFSNSLWSVYNDPAQAALVNHPSAFNGNYTREFIFGGATASSDPSGGILLPEELWNIDTKIDDGKPAVGKVVLYVRANCAVASNGAALTSSNADAAKLDSQYNLSNSSKVCAAVFRQAF